MHQSFVLKSRNTSIFKVMLIWKKLEVKKLCSCEGIINNENVAHPHSRPCDFYETFSDKANFKAKFLLQVEIEQEERVH